jgi:hypothetical protein
MCYRLRVEIILIPSKGTDVLPSKGRDYVFVPSKGTDYLLVPSKGTDYLLLQYRLRVEI